MRTWWKVEFDAEDKVSLAERVELPGTSSDRFFFVLAANEQSAQKKARASLNAVRVAKRRAKYKADGKCRCGRALDIVEFQLCDVCRNAARPSVAKQDGYLLALLDVRDKWIELPSVGSFGLWLSETLTDALGAAPEFRNDSMRERVDSAKRRLGIAKQ